MDESMGSAVVVASLTISVGGGASSCSTTGFWLVAALELALVHDFAISSTTSCLLRAACFIFSVCLEPFY